MKKEKQIAVLSGLVVFLLILVGVVVCVTHKNFVDLLDTCDSYSELLDEQADKYKGTIKYWKEHYDKLQVDYYKLLNEKEELEKTVNGVYFPSLDYTEEELHIIASCVEAEAGNYKNHQLSQRYITQVIINRVNNEKFPNSVEEVIYQKVNGVPQFSVAYNGMMKSEVDINTLYNVYCALIYGTDLPENVCYFYSDSVRGNWVNTLSVYDTIEGTVFAYDDKEDNKNE